MSAVKKTESRKKTAPAVSKKTQPRKQAQPSVMNWYKTPFIIIWQRTQNFLQRRPHRTFRRTYRRDYTRSLKLPGFISFTAYVAKALWARKLLFLGVVIIYGILTALFVGLASQDTYNQLTNTLNSNSDKMLSGGWGELGKASLLFASSVTGGLNDAQSGGDVGTQQVVVAVLALLITWLTTVWLLRAILAGQKPRLRDGMYNSGSPIIPTFLVTLVAVVQLLPVALVMIGIAAASSVGILDGGVESMVFAILALLLTALSLYWLTTTLLALVVVTLPGMYPIKALRTAGDLVIGRRIRILLRLLWAALIIAVAWIIVMIPMILFDGWIKKVLPAIVNVPIIPVALLVMSSLTVVWAASYIYLLYRKVVDDDAAPA